MHSQSGSTGTAFGVDATQLSIDKANSVPLVEIFKRYNINIDQFNKKTCCPFPHGKIYERTPSFYYYVDTNSFFCFGCKKSGSTSKFVSYMENVTPYKASLLVLEDFKNVEVTVENDRQGINFRFILEFSSILREFMQANSSNENALKYAEKLGETFDVLRSRHQLGEKEAEKLVKKISLKLEQYNCLNY